MAIDNSIALQYNPTPNKSDIQQFAAQYQEQQQTNAINSIMSDPANRNPDGSPNANALNKIMAVNPKVGMQMQTQLIANEHQKALTSSEQIDATSKKVDLMGKGNNVALNTYNDALQSGLSPEQAKAKAQEVYTDQRAQLARSGHFSEQELPPTQFDPIKSMAFKTNQERMQAAKFEYEKQQDAAAAAAKAREDAETQRYHSGELSIRQKESEKVGWSPNPVVGKDGNLYSVNTITGESRKIDVGPGATKMGSSTAKPQDVDVTVKNPDGSIRTVSAQEVGSDLIDRNGNKIDGSTVQTITKMGSGSGARSGDAADIQAIHKTNPNATQVQIDDYLGLKKSMQNLQKQSDVIEAQSKTASDNFQLALKNYPKDKFTDAGPWINKWIQEGDVALGDKTIPPYVAALLSSANETAKVLSGATGSAGATNSSREETAHIMNSAFSKGQLQKVGEVMQKEMANRRNDYVGQVDEIKSKMGEIETGKPAQKQSSKSNPTFDSVDAAEAAVRNGTIKIKPGDKVMINGRQATWSE